MRLIARVAFIGVLGFAACSQERQSPPDPTPPVDLPSPSVKSPATESRVLTGPAPRSELIGEDPTPATIARDLGGWYPHPELNKVVRIDDRDVKRWQRFYDGVELEVQPVTSKSGYDYVTRFTPELTAPERVQRDKLIGEDAAAKASGLPVAATTKILYMANLAQRQLAGTRGDNAVDFIHVVASWRLVYQVEGTQGGVFVDAYTGEVVRRWNNWVN